MRPLASPSDARDNRAVAKFSSLQSRRPVQRTSYVWVKRGDVPTTAKLICLTSILHRILTKKKEKKETFRAKCSKNAEGSAQEWSLNVEETSQHARTIPSPCPRPLFDTARVNCHDATGHGCITEITQDNCIDAHISDRVTRKVLISLP
ncbi:hypothetical protein Y032_0020g228 [Ancylostoma ceylanicum]|uniref:Uncharacterized protein n=1 Tax=Ancylostoma ceylanicum TaxID=53326 RepID=A0A016V0E3_9BILA|nr:hypothetical protein Y032_0020g228 [Ancylostoma ceylanicum]